jgi:Protein of unknown function (DUF3224)
MIRPTHRPAPFGLFALLVAVTPLHAQAATVSHHAAGAFDVKLELLTSEVDSAIDRRSLVKEYHGDLTATGRGVMLSGGMGPERSGGYVAIEKVEGTLEGKRGGFLLQHDGVMTRGTPALAIRILPDSGTDELVGITGTMSIVIKDGKHYYELEYTLPDRS